ncbi:MAG: AzlD domain-containing protein [Rhodospirillaceae bacterium]|nr:AzlD domain-containing protein [Rhodospirillaceae bacterium]
MSDPLYPWFVIGIAAIVTYGWRFAGVLLGGRIDTNSRLFRWSAAVAYALLAALIARMILMPEGPLAATDLTHRLAAAAAAAFVFFLTRRNLLLGCAAGMAVLVLLSIATA